MGTTAEKLTYLNTTKQNLKIVINTTGAGLTDESTFRSYANVLNDKILGAINGDVDLFEEYPKVSGNGTDLSLNGVVEGKMSITPQGVSSQDGEPTPTTPIPVKSVTGENSVVLQNENLFDSELEQNAWSNSNGTGTIWSNQYIRSKDFVEIKPNTTYTLNYSMENNSAKNGNILLYDENQNFINSIPTPNNLTFTTPPTAKYLKFNFYASAGANVSGMSELQLVKGSTAPSTYVEHEEQNYQLSLGNIELNSTPDGTIRDEIIGSSDVSYNLLDINHLTAGIFYTTSGAIGTNSVWSQSDYILVQSNTSYVLSSTYKTADSSFEITQFDENKNWILTEQMSLGTEKIRTTEANTKYIRIGLRNDRVLEYQTQFTEGSEVKPYFPYGQVGMWYKREYIGKVVLDGSENWTAESGGAPYTLNISNSLITISNDELPNVLVDMFKRVTYNSNWNNYNSLVAPGTTLRPTILKFRYTDISSLDDWKVWLSENNVTVYYLKAEYTDIPITDSTLINQLNDIYNNAHSYNGVTNITTTYEDGNEQMYLDIEALKNVWEVTE